MQNDDDFNYDACGPVSLPQELEEDILHLNATPQLLLTKHTATWLTQPAH